MTAKQGGCDRMRQVSGEILGQSALLAPLPWIWECSWVCLSWVVTPYRERQKLFPGQSQRQGPSVSQAVSHASPLLCLVL